MCQPTKKKVKFKTPKTHENKCINEIKILKFEDLGEENHEKV